MDKVIADQFYASEKIIVNMNNDEIISSHTKSILRDCYALFVRLNAQFGIDEYGSRKIRFIHKADITIRWSYDVFTDTVELQITRPGQFLDISYHPEFFSKSENIEWQISIWTSHNDIVEGMVAILLLLV